MRSEPIRPAILIPLKTRPGVAHAPIEPGDLCFLFTPCDARSPWKPCLFITPAKPCPREVPVTSTASPAVNTSAFNS